MKASIPSPYSNNYLMDNYFLIHIELGMIVDRLEMLIWHMAKIPGDILDLRLKIYFVTTKSCSIRANCRPTGETVNRSCWCDCNGDPYAFLQRKRRHSDYSYAWLYSRCIGRFRSQDNLPISGKPTFDM